MTNLQNDTFIRALLRQPTDYTPLWLMRQAGRYLPEYKATRARAGSFLNLAKSPEMACEVTLQPLERFDLDAAILFSDILTVPDAMGLGLHFVEGEGPRFSHPLRDEQAIRNLPVPDPNDSLRYVMDAVRTIRSALNGKVPLIGFSGSPWTLACYMIEGQGSRDYQHIKTMMYTRPDLLKHILAVTSKAVSVYLQAQIEAGAQAVMVFDTWGGVLADGDYQRYSLEPMREVFRTLPPSIEQDGETIRVPSIVFTKGGGLWLEQIAGVGADAVGLDWTINMAQARSRVGDLVALQGNLDPMALMASPEQVQAQATKVLESYGPPSEGHGHVFNLGHGISQFTPPESVSALVEAVHTYSKKQRKA
jgi:uroporphyrinogen decarboxylase